MKASPDIERVTCCGSATLSRSECFRCNRPPRRAKDACGSKAFPINGLPRFGVRPKGRLRLSAPQTVHRLVIRSLILFLAIPLAVGCTPGENGETGCPFTFSAPRGEERLVKYLQHTCKTIRMRVAEDLDLQDLGPIQVTIVSTQKDFLSAQPEGQPSRPWAAALAYPSQGKILLKSPKLLLGGQPAYERLFFHEVAHIALHRALTQSAAAASSRPGAERSGPPLRSFSVSVPHWLQEGYAIYLSRDWSLNREVVLTRAALRKALIPLGRLVTDFPEDEEEARLAYAQSADLVHYLVHGYGRERFQRFLKILGQGHRFGTASRLAFGMDFFSLEKEWRKHMRRRYSWVPLLGSTGMLWFLASLVFLAAYLRKKLSAKAKLAQWSEEDPF